jgi:hypothetical protein
MYHSDLVAQDSLQALFQRWCVKMSNAKCRQERCRQIQMSNAKCWLKHSRLATYRHAGNVEISIRIQNNDVAFRRIFPSISILFLCMTARLKAPHPSPFTLNSTSTFFCRHFATFPFQLIHKEVLFYLIP